MLQKTAPEPCLRKHRAPEPEPFRFYKSSAALLETQFGSRTLEDYLFLVMLPRFCETALAVFIPFATTLPMGFRI